MVVCEENEMKDWRIKCKSSHRFVEAKPILLHEMRKTQNPLNRWQVFRLLVQKMLWIAWLYHRFYCSDINTRILYFGTGSLLMPSNGIVSMTISSFADIVSLNSFFPPYTSSALLFRLNFNIFIDFFLIRRDFFSNRRDFFSIVAIFAQSSRFFWQLSPFSYCVPVRTRCYESQQILGRNCKLGSQCKMTDMSGKAINSMKAKTQKPLLVRILWQIYMR